MQHAVPLLPHTPRPLPFGLPLHTAWFCYAGSLLVRCWFTLVRCRRCTLRTTRCVADTARTLRLPDATRCTRCRTRTRDVYARLKLTGLKVACRLPFFTCLLPLVLLRHHTRTVHYACLVTFTPALHTARALRFTFWLRLYVWMRYTGSSTTTCPTHHTVPTAPAVAFAVWFCWLVRWFAYTPPSGSTLYGYTFWFVRTWFTYTRFGYALHYCVASLRTWLLFSATPHGYRIRGYTTRCRLRLPTLRGYTYRAAGSAGSVLPDIVLYSLPLQHRITCTSFGSPLRTPHYARFIPACRYLPRFWVLGYAYHAVAVHVLPHFGYCLTCPQFTVTAALAMVLRDLPLTHSSAPTRSHHGSPHGFPS